LTTPNYWSYVQEHQKELYYYYYIKQGKLAAWDAGLLENSVGFKEFVNKYRDYNMTILENLYHFYQNGNIR